MVIDNEQRNSIHRPKNFEVSLEAIKHHFTWVEHPEANKQVEAAIKVIPLLS